MSDQTIERVTALIAPEVTAAGLSLYDLEHAGGVLRVVVDRPGGVDIEAIAAITRAVSRLLDEHDPLPGHYTLEVSSPGLERRLRVPAHFAGAVGETRQAQAPRRGRRRPRAERRHRVRRRRRHGDPGRRRPPTTGHDRPPGRLLRHRTGPHRVRLGPSAKAGQGQRCSRHPTDTTGPREEGSIMTWQPGDDGSAPGARGRQGHLRRDAAWARSPTRSRPPTRSMPDAHEYAWVTIDPDTVDIRVMRAGARRGRRARRPRARRHARPTSAASPRRPSSQVMTPAPPRGRARD